MDTFLFGLYKKDETKTAVMNKRISPSHEKTNKTD